eukprot:GHVL01021524.1.p1 GENE.GHVL01021524.1~~GHVL01021524.1.p1  ORF type:complete len:932 (+),score=125.38 GHVL01021524.1:411-3206(+)
MTFNTLWTSVPIVTQGVLEKQLPDVVCELLPFMYSESRLQQSSNSQTFIFWTLQAIFNSTVLCTFIYVTFIIYGNTNDITTFGSALFFSCLVSVTFKLIIQSRNWNIPFLVSSFLSIALFIPFFVIYSHTGFPNEEMKGVAHTIWRAPIIFFGALIGIFIVFLLDYFIWVLIIKLFPRPTDFVINWLDSYKYLIDEYIKSDVKICVKERILESFDVKALPQRIFKSRHLKMKKLEYLPARTKTKLNVSDEEGDKNRKSSVYEIYNPPEGATSNIERMMHWFWLTFNDHSLQKQFQYHVIFKNIRDIRLCLIFIGGMVGIWAVYESVLNPGDTVNIIVRCLFPAGWIIIWLLTYLKTALRNYFVFMPCLVTAVLIIKLVLEVLQKRDAVISTAAVPVVIFNILRLPFKMSFWLNGGVMVAYTIRYAVFPSDDDSVNILYQLSDYLPVLGGISTFTAYIAHRLQYFTSVGWVLNQLYKDELQRQRSILNNMLPEFVVDRMISVSGTLRDELGLNSLAVTVQGSSSKHETSDDPLARELFNVSILFCDICDFVQLVGTLQPLELVRVLDRLFTRFDELCYDHGVTKIETVSETYLCVGGLKPDGQEYPDPKDGAHATMLLAIDMIETVRNRFTLGDIKLELKVGIHTGRVVSGVVGTRKPQYAMFGDTVNVASRMKSTGEKGTVHISAVTYELLKMRTFFEFEQRSTEVKGKGIMSTYLLTNINEAVIALEENNQLFWYLSDFHYEDNDEIPEVSTRKQSEEASSKRTSIDNPAILENIRANIPSKDTKAAPIIQKSSSEEFVLRRTVLDHFMLSFTDNRERQYILEKHHSQDNIRKVEHALVIWIIFYMIQTVESQIFPTADGRPLARVRVATVKFSMLFSFLCLWFLLRYNNNPSFKGFFFKYKVISADRCCECSVFYWSCCLSCRAILDAS